MAESEDRDDSQASDESVEIPVNVVDDSEAEQEGAEAEERVEGKDGQPPEPTDADSGGREDAESADSQPAGPEGEEEEDIFLPHDESDVEVVDGEDGQLAGPVDSEEPEDGEVAELRERIRELEEQNEELAEERDEYEDRMMRVAADFENFKKRAKRNEEELKKYGVKPLASDLLSAIDNLERAVEHAKSSEEENIIDGVEMVVSQMHNTLEKHGVEVFDAVGENFNPEQHEAIQQVETPEHESGEVLEQFQRGYFIHDRLLRPALVAVAKHVEEEADEDEAAEADKASETQEE